MIELPMVNTSKNDLEDFDIKKIQQSLIKETGLDEELARDISVDVIRELIKSNAKILTSPEIRELTCATLMRKRYHAERFLYTRLGMPLYDFLKLQAENIPIEEKKERLWKQISFEAQEVQKIVKRLKK